MYPNRSERRWFGFGPQYANVLFGHQIIRRLFGLNNIQFYDSSYTFKRNVKFILRWFKDGRVRKLRPGDLILTCAREPHLKRVTYINITGPGDIEYNNGSNSLWHCGWDRVKRRNATETFREVARFA